MQISAEQVRAQLARILTSESFSSAGRHRRFLEFIVEQTLAGNQDHIKESVVGTEVFDRPADFDPRADGIVRVEATKLRGRLAAYYEGPGRSDPVRIDVPRGTYVPRFTQNKSEPALQTPSRSRLQRLLAVSLLILVAVSVWFLRGRYSVIPQPAIESIAVLPFLNLSAAPESEYFSDGLTEQLTDVLARSTNLRVVARTSAFSFKGKPENVIEIGEKLRAGAIVEGSVRRSGDQVRITVQLIRASDGYHLWSDNYDRPLRDVFELQDQMAAQIAQTLRVELSDEAQRRSAARYTRDLEAFDLYLRARHLMEEFRLASSLEARRLFDLAKERDPNFAAPYLGVVAAMMRGAGAPVSPQQFAAQVEANVNKALELDPSWPDAHMARGIILLSIHHDAKAAEKEFRLGLTHNPDAANAHRIYATDLLLKEGRIDEALTECSLAADLDPVNPDGICRPWILTFSNPGEAIKEYNQILKAQPDSHAIRAALGVALVHAGLFNEAVPVLEATAEGSGGQTMLAYTYARLGRTADLEPLLAKSKFYPPGDEAGMRMFVALGLGNLDDARAAAEQVVRMPGQWNWWVAVSPICEPLQKDPKFQQTLRSLPFPPL